MGMKIPLGEVVWYPRDIVYRRDNGKIYAKLTPTLHIEVQQKGRHKAWTTIGRDIETIDPEEIVELLEKKK